MFDVGMHVDTYMIQVSSRIFIVCIVEILDRKTINNFRSTNRGALRPKNMFQGGSNDRYKHHQTLKKESRENQPTMQDKRHEVTALKLEG